MIIKNKKIQFTQKTISTFSAILISLLLMTDVNAKNTDQEAQKIIAEQLKATFNQTTFKNFSRAPMQGWWQAEISFKTSQ